MNGKARGENRLLPFTCRRQRVVRLSATFVMLAGLRSGMLAMACVRAHRHFRGELVVESTVEKELHRLWNSPRLSLILVRWGVKRTNDWLRVVSLKKPVAPERIRHTPL